jgi:effector-binding domain-containing protein
LPPTAYRKAAEPIAFPPALCGVHYGIDEAVSRFVPLQEGSKMIDVRIETHPSREAPEGCELLNLAGGEVAVGVHKGPYRNLQGSYDWLFGQWLPGSGREVANAPPHEIYVNDPQSTPENDLITHICVPLVSAKAHAQV